MKQPISLPAPDTAWFDPKTGKPTQAVYQYLRSLDATVRELAAQSGA